jgi:hypothetical protein
MPPPRLAGGASPTTPSWLTCPSPCQQPLAAARAPATGGSRLARRLRVQDWAVVRVGDDAPGAGTDVGSGADAGIASILDSVTSGSQSTAAPKPTKPEGSSPAPSPDDAAVAAEVPAKVPAEVPVKAPAPAGLGPGVPEEPVLESVRLRSSATAAPPPAGTPARSPMHRPMRPPTSTQERRRAQRARRCSNRCRCRLLTARSAILRTSWRWPAWTSWQPSWACLTVSAALARAALRPPC